MFGPNATIVWRDAVAPRREPPPRAPAPILTAEQIRQRIEKLNRCVEELRRFEPETVQKRYNIPEVLTLEASIKEALIAAFGPGTERFEIFASAATLDQGPHQMRMASEFGRGPVINYEAKEALEARKHLAEGRERAIQLLERAVQALEDDLADMRSPDPQAAPHGPRNGGKKVFVVHGHDGEAREAVARFLSEKLDLEPVILHERPNKGRTLITKLREEAAEAGFAVVILTPDDLGRALNAAELNPRARQNVVFELGFFIGALGPERVAAILKGDVERPSDFDGVVYLSYEKEEWRTKLGQELQAAGYTIDWNKVMVPR